MLTRPSSDTYGTTASSDANRSARAEFWSLYDGPLTVTGVTPRPADYEFFYNYQRPHASLAYRTPNEYLVQLEAA